MRTSENYTQLFEEPPQTEPKVAMLFVYIVLGLSLCVFVVSIWFSSYAKDVVFQQRPAFDEERGKIQYEIQALELEENALVDVERVRKLTQELGLVEPTGKPIELLDR